MIINKNYLTNNVDASNQTKYRAYFSGAIDEEDSFRVMFIGNSITLHEKKPEIGWFFDHGMAASKPSKDYVHILKSKLSHKYNKKVASLVYNAGYFELNYENKDQYDSIVKYAKDFKPDLIVFRLGENVRDNNLNEEVLFDVINKLIIELKSTTKNMVMTSLFWRHEIIDRVLEKVAINNNIKFADIKDLGDYDENKALNDFDHPGVRVHPNDLGMKKIAERIFQKL